MSEKRKKVVDSDSDSDSEEISVKPEKKSTKKAASEAAASESRELVIDLGGKRKVTVSEFRGTTYVNIREFYTDKATGEEKPGSKGIALTKEQWRILVEKSDQISAALPK